MLKIENNEQLLELMNKAATLGGSVRVFIDTNGVTYAEYTGPDEMGEVPIN